jgi:hypothetical protein
MISGKAMHIQRPSACRRRNGMEERKIIPMLISGGATLFR